jgi:large subunit ribosomal protein L4
MEVSIYTREGKDSGKKAELKDSIFGIEPNETVLYEDVRRHQANKRQGTAKTKERGEVRGGGRKAYRQKGTGMARRGSIRSPLLIGGGTTFGPKPRTYTVKMTKKMRQLARRSALSQKASDENIVVTEDWTFRSPKTRKIVDILESLDLYGKKVLVVTKDTDRDVYLSARNIPGVQVVEASKPTTYDIMNADVLLIQESGLEALQGILEPKNDEVAA